MAKKIFPSSQSFRRYFKRHGRLILAGAVLGLIGAWQYMKQVPREALAEATTGRAGGLDFVSNLSPEAKVFVVFVLTGMLIATVVANYGGKK